MDSTKQAVRMKGMIFNMVKFLFLTMKYAAGRDVPWWEDIMGYVGKGL